MSGSRVPGWVSWPCDTLEMDKTSVICSSCCLLLCAWSENATTEVVARRLRKARHTCTWLEEGIIDSPYTPNVGVFSYSDMGTAWPLGSG